MSRATPCNLHGTAYTYGCPGCDLYDDHLIWREIKWRLRRSDWFPYRVYDFKEDAAERFIDGDGAADESIFGPAYWMAPRRHRRFWRPIVKLLNRRSSSSVSTDR